LIIIASFHKSYAVDLFKKLDKPCGFENVEFFIAKIDAILFILFTNI